MHIPYVLEFIHGTSGMITGHLMEMLAVNKTASDQLEPATMLPAEFWSCCDESAYAIAALIDCLGALKVDKQRMADGAQAHWVQLTTLLAWLVNDKKMSFRVAHQLLSVVARDVVVRGLAPADLTVEMVEEAAAAYTGEKIGLTEDVLHTVTDAWTGVTGRRYRGGTAPERVEAHLEAAKRHVQADAQTLRRFSRRVSEAAKRRDAAFAALKLAIDG